MKDFAKSYELNKCGLEILSETQYEDSFPNVYRVMIHIINVRMNSQAVDAYLDAKEHLTESDIRMRLWEKKIHELAGITVREEEGFSATQNVSEFFTIVYMENLKKYGRQKSKHRKPAASYMCESDFVYDQIESMLGGIAEDNAGCSSSTCMSTRDSLLSLAKELLGADARDELENFYHQTAAELSGEFDD